MIYFMQQQPGIGPIKIGVAIDPERRLGEIQLTCPVPLFILKTIPGNRNKERGIHFHFSHLRLHGEWFRADSELLDFIANPYDIPEIGPSTNSTLAVVSALPDNSYSEFLTPEQAAAALGISPALIRRYCRQGRLGQHIGGRWMISANDLGQFKNKPRQSGNPDFGPQFWPNRGQAPR